MPGTVWSRNISQFGTVLSGTVLYGHGFKNYLRFFICFRFQESVKLDFLVTIIESYFVNQFVGNLLIRLYILFQSSVF